MRRELEVGKNQHATQAVPDPVDPIVSGLALDVVENRRHVVVHQVVDRPVPLTAFSQECAAHKFVDALVPHVSGLARAANVKNVTPRSREPTTGRQDGCR